jgi:hypothetical protein
MEIEIFTLCDYDFVGMSPSLVYGIPTNKNAIDKKAE